MNDYVLRYTDRAEADLLEIGDYTESIWGIDQRNKYLLNLFGDLERIRKNPNLGRKRDELRRGMRSRVVQQHIVYYSAIGDEIHVIAILHARMDPTLHLK